MDARNPLVVCCKKEEKMARLPQPGGDTNTWGEVLNDYLSQSLASDGTLKAGVVGTTQIANNAVTSAKIPSGAITTAHIANGSVTAAKLASGAAATADKGIRLLSVFYSPPNIMNGTFSDDYAAGYLSRFDDVVLASGLQDSGHTYHASTVAIIQKVKALNGDTVLWGYVDASTTFTNHTLAEIQTIVDQWLAIGADGIFVDLFGYDYGVSRTRQNDILNYIHSKGVGAFLNVWNWDDAFGSTVDATYNPAGTPTVANSSDVGMLESWVCNSDAYASPYFTTISDIKTRADKARTYRTSLGVRIFAINIMLHTGTSSSDLDSYYGITEGMARAFRLDGTGLAPSNYSSTGSDIGVLLPRKSAYGSLPFRASASYWLNSPWTQVQAPDLGITINYDPGTGTYNWSQS